MAQPALACVVDPDPLKAAHSKYSKIATLGQGSFGFVQLCKGRDASGREEYAAIKVRCGVSACAARGVRACMPSSAIYSMHASLMVTCHATLPCHLQFLKRDTVNKCVFGGHGMGCLQHGKGCDGACNLTLRCMHMHGAMRRHRP